MKSKRKARKRSSSRIKRSRKTSPSGRKTSHKLTRKVRKTSPSRPTPLNMSLYNKIKAEAKKKFKVWPSAYASGWLVAEYKRRGGKYGGQRTKSEGIGRWFKEKWINVCRLPKIVVCGRSRAEMKNYPYCRPLYRVSPQTPKTAREISKKEIQRRCREKRKSPMKKVK